MGEGHRQRLIEKVMTHGIEVLLEHEYLELFLFSIYKRCDTNPIAHRLLKKFGDLENLCNASIDELTSVDGVGDAVAKQIKLLPYIAKGYSLHTSVKDKQKFDSYESICNRCVALLEGNVNEVVYVLCFDSSLHLIKEAKVAEGAPGYVNVDPRKIMDIIASTSTHSIAMCHNHPSGNLIPSQNDIVTTRTISDLMKTVGIEFIDHIIVSDNKYISCKII